MKAVLAALVVVVAAACSSGGTTPVIDLDDGRVVVAEIGPTERRDLDLLLVYDDSGGSVFTEGWPASAMYWTGEGWDGRPPNLHYGVISQDMGGGSYEIPGCDHSRDGQLQDAPRGTCDPPTDAYIIDIDDGQGGRTRNYTGSLDEAMTCISRLGIEGCGFEQPLAALRRAVDGTQPYNAGFLRPDAALLIVILMDEDDCSVVDSSLFDPDDTSLGPLSSLRCFEYGVTCHEGDPDLRQPGYRGACEPREPSPYMMPLDDIFDAVVGAKPTRADIGVVAAYGGTDLIRVDVIFDDPARLAPACAGITGEATPGIRLESFVGRFGTRGLSHSACTPTDYSALAESVGSMAQRVLGVPCVTAAIAAPADCVAELVDYTAGEPTRSSIPACNPEQTNQPCFAVEAATTCSAYPASLGLQYLAATPLTADQRLELRCRP